MSIRWEITDGNAVIRPDRRFDLHSAKRFREVLGKVCTDPTVVDCRIDLGEVAYIDSAGLGLLLVAREVAARKGRGVALCNIRSEVKQAIDRSGLSRLFTVQA